MLNQQLKSHGADNMQKIFNLGLTSRSSTTKNFSSLVTRQLLGDFKKWQDINCINIDEQPTLLWHNAKFKLFHWWPLVPIFGGTTQLAKSRLLIVDICCCFKIVRPDAQVLFSSQRPFDNTFDLYLFTVDTTLKFKDVWPHAQEHFFEGPFFKQLCSTFGGHLASLNLFFVYSFLLCGGTQHGTQQKYLQ